MAQKKTKGRQKIEMKRIQNEDDRLITFSKRRSGIYKKASELVTLTGTEVAFVVFSPAGKPFSFAHPSIDYVANRFLGKDPVSNDKTHPLVEAHRQIRIDELNQQHNELLRQLDGEKEKGKELKHKLKGKEIKGWWDAPIEELNMQELVQLEGTFKDLHLNLRSKIAERTNGASSSSSRPYSMMNPTHMANPFASGANETNPPFFPPGYGYGYGRPQF